MRTPYIVIVLMCVTMIGCGSKETQPGSATNESTASETATASIPAVDGDSHGHTHSAGPHGGTIMDWGGGKYHVELTIDQGKKIATAYILASDEKTPSPIAAENVELVISSPATTVILEPNPTDDDPEGRVSRYAGEHDSLASVHEISGTMTALIEGTPFSGDFRMHVH